MKAACILLSLLLLAHSSLAKVAKPKARNKEHYDPTAIKSLDLVFKHLDSVSRHGGKAHARSLGRAYEALESQQTARARALASAALGDPLFSDDAHWIVGSAFQAEAEKRALAQRGDAGAAELAFRHFRAVLLGSPYSPLIHASFRQLAESELLLGYGLAPGRIAVARFEDAFERLARAGALYEVLPNETVKFAKACSRAPNDLCAPWLLRLTERMEGGSDELAAIAALYPIVKDRPRKPDLPPRPTQAYHAPDLDLAALSDALSSYSAQKWSDAKDKLQKFLDEFPRSAYRYRARYWLARSLVEHSDKDEAKKQYGSLLQDSPLSYYGLLSSIDTSAPIDQEITHAYPEAVDRDPLLSAAETYHLRRAEALLAARAGALAALDLREIRPRSALSSPFLMYLCALNYRAKNYPTLFSILSELIQRDYPAVASDMGLKMIFPVEHMKEISRYARQDGLDPILVLSLIKQESAFDPHALSGVGAAGLMQLMYFTATQTVPGVSRDDLMDPEQNIKTGTRYLANLLERYHGNIVFALAAYNAGPAATDRWIRDGQKQSLGMLDFIESIPYRETREYVSSIIRNYYWYSKLLGTSADPDSSKPDPKPLSYFWKPYSG